MVYNSRFVLKVDIPLNFLSNEHWPHIKVSHLKAVFSMKHVKHVACAGEAGECHDQSEASIVTR